MKKEKNQLLAGLAVSLLLVSPVKAEEPIVARVGNDPISATQLQALLPPLETAQWQQMLDQPEMIAQWVKKMLLQNVVLQLAEENHWADHPQVAQALQRARDQALIDSYLAAVSRVPDDYPRAADLQAYYAAHREALQVPKRLQLAQIYIAGTVDSDVPKLQEVAKRLEQEPEAFATLARTYSDDVVSAERGGQLGWVAQHQVIPELRSVVESLNAGDTAGPVRSAQGWHFLYCHAVEEARELQLEEVRSALVQHMRAEREAANRNAFLQRVAQDYPIAINELELEKVLVEAAKDS